MRGKQGRFWFGLIILAFFMWGCGESPSEAPSMLGSIEVQGFLLPDGTPADSIYLIFDEDTLGYKPNPYLLASVVAGQHYLEIKTVALYQSDLLTYYSSPQFVTVGPHLTSIAHFNLETTIPVAPYVGYRAPDFALTNINSDTVRLSELTGEVVLLYFFAST